MRKNEVERNIKWRWRSAKGQLVPGSETKEMQEKNSGKEKRKGKGD